MEINRDNKQNNWPLIEHLWDYNAPKETAKKFKELLLEAKEKDLVMLK